MSVPVRQFGLTTLTCLVIAAMIGAGVFTTSGYSLAALGSPARVLVAWLIGGAIAICGAVAYGGLAQRMPESGGEYLYLSRQLHPLAGFLTGWVSLTAGFSASIALSALTFEKYVVPQSVWPEWLPPGSVAMLIVLLCGLGHSFVVPVAAMLQNGVVLVKLATLLIFLLTAAAATNTAVWHWEPVPAAADAPPSVSTGLSDPALWYAMATSVMWISLSYAGFNAAIYVASEVREPATCVPRAMWLGTTITTGLYLLLNLVFVTAAPAAQLAGQADVAAVAAESLGGAWLGGLLRLAIGLAALSSVAGMIMTGPRIYSRMADDGVFPAYFCSGTQAIPRTVLLQTLLAVLLILTASLRELLGYMGTTLSLSSAVTVATLFLNRGEVTAGRLRLAAAALYVLATVISVVLMTVGDVRQLFGTLITLSVGSLLWPWIRRKCT